MWAWGVLVCNMSLDWFMNRRAVRCVDKSGYGVVGFEVYVCV